MAKRQFTLTETEINELKRAENSSDDARTVKRIQAVRLYGTGWSVKTIEEIIGCSWRSLMEWCQEYRAEGIAGLKSKWQGENARKLSREQRADLKDKLNRYQPDQVIAPTLRISQGAFWTISDLQVVVEQWYGVSYRSQTSYRMLLHACRFSQQHTSPQYRSRADEQAIADFEIQLEKK